VELKNTMKEIRKLFAWCFVLAFAAFTHAQARPDSDHQAVPLVIGETFTINSKTRLPSASQWLARRWFQHG